MMPKPADVSTGNVTAQEQQSDHGGENKGGNGETKSDAPALKPDMESWCQAFRTCASHDFVPVPAAAGSHLLYS